MYKNGNYKDLAVYIHKEVDGKKRIKTSRNLTKPVEDCKRTSKKKMKKLEQGEAKQVLDEYRKDYDFIENERFDNEYTGANFNFVFLRKDSFAVKRKAGRKRE